MAAQFDVKSARRGPAPVALGRLGKHRRRLGGCGNFSDHHYNRIKVDQYRPGHFGQVRMGSLHFLKYGMFCPLVSVETLWSLISELIHEYYAAIVSIPTRIVLPTAVTSLLIAGMLHICFIAYGILKECLVTRDGIASPVLVLASRLTSVLLGGSIMILKERRFSFAAPLHHFIPFAITNELSTWVGYEMLKYVSFPVQVMAKSCKMLPTMIMGSYMGVAKYSFYEYLQATCALVCVAVMHFADEQNDRASHSNGDGGQSQTFQNAIIGSLLLIVFFTADSFTSQSQSGLYKKHKELTQTEMMVAGNVVGLLVSTFSLAFKWSSFLKSLGKAMEDPAVMMRICGLGLSGAMGQFCIYLAIKVLGPLSFTWIMTARQLLSVLISLVWFGHKVSAVKISCIVIVFTIMSSKHLAKMMPQVWRCPARRRRPEQRPQQHEVSELSPAEVQQEIRPQEFRTIDDKEALTLHKNPKDSVQGAALE